MDGRELKDRTYAEFARIGAALSSDKRLELIDLLAQTPRGVEDLAQRSGMSVANTSQHLQALKAARLVDTAREGTRVIYRLAGEDVLRLWIELRSVAEGRLAEVRAIILETSEDQILVQRDEAAALSPRRYLFLDVRPLEEYEHGHLPNAVTLPLDELVERIDELPVNKRIIVYCRGAYCLLADEAVALLRERGFDAVRLEGGWPEWVAEGRPSEVGPNKS